MNVWFDAKIKVRSGKRVPFWDRTSVESEVKDKDLMWFHEGYGMMGLYRLHIVDKDNAVAEDLHKWCSTESEKWEDLAENPELALTMEK